MAIEVGKRFGTLTVTEIVEDEGVVRCTCDCGVRRVLSSAELVDHRRCGPACSLVVLGARTARGARAAISTAGRERFQGKPGIRAVVSARMERVDLDEFCISSDPAKYLVVYPDGSRTVAETFEDALILWREPAAAEAFGAAA
jgi:hypothetical protein